MARLSNYPDDVAQGWLNTPLPSFESTPWTPARDLASARLAIVTTAGLHRRSDQRFAAGNGDYRLIPGDVDLSELIQSHVSVHIDRSAFQRDANAVFPLQHLRRLHQDGEVGSLASWHHSFMGATDPSRMVEAAGRVAGLLRDDGVDAVILVPV